MKMCKEEKIKRQRDFLKRKNSDRPLIGCISGWENLSRYVQDTEAFFPKGKVAINDLSCDRFLSMYQECAGTLNEPDDLFRTLEPLPFFPWTEAALGCPVRYTGKNFWSSPLEETKTQEGREKWIEAIREQSSLSSAGIMPDTSNVSSSRGIPEWSRQWVAKYGEFLDFLSENFDERFPIGQSIFRGPLDMAAAVFGDENMIYLLFDQPSMMKEVLSMSTTIYLSFIEVQKSRMRRFEGGYVIGQYYVWTPGSCLRHQEDAMSLLSLDLYQKFVHAHDRAIASAVEYSLFHLHSTGLHLLDFLLENDGIRIIQISKDEGVDLETILPSLHQVQQAGKCLLLKGRLNRDDLQIIRKCLDVRGLCIQAVVLDQKEADAVLSAFS